MGDNSFLYVGEGVAGMGADELAGRVASAAYLRSVVAVLINLCGCPLEQGKWRMLEGNQVRRLGRV